jgi:signal transduction histidine kinase
VILNVIKNAIDALEASRAGKIEITLRVSRDSNELVVSFHDNGPGIEPEHLPRIFEPFFSTKPPGKGTGLGLAMCRRVIQEHRGEIRIESERCLGTTVTIWLPIEA